VTSSADVDTAKPEPDIVSVALERAGVDVAHAVFVGDTVWDVEACKRAGVPTTAVLSGGVSRGELETAGAQTVYDNPRDLCEHLDSTRSGRWPRPSRRPDQPSSCRHSVSTSHSSNRPAVQPRTLTSRSKIAGSIASQTTSTASW
jgi:hypothetical protein